MQSDAMKETKKKSETQRRSSSKSKAKETKSNKKKESVSKSPAEIKRNKSFKLILNSVLGTFTIIISIGVLYNLTKYSELTDELKDINDSLAIEVQQQNDYEDQVRYLKSDEYIEKIAREQLGMVKPNEILYINGS